MNLIPWKSKDIERSAEPFHEMMTQFRTEFDRLFNRFLSPPAGMGGWPAWSGAFEWGPKVDLADTETAVEVKVEVPGVDPKDLDIEVADNVLLIRGEKSRDREEKKRNYYYAEREYGTFSRSIPLPATVSAEKVEASFKDGVLTVTLPKKPGAQSKKITVRHA